MRQIVKRGAILALLVVFLAGCAGTTGTVSKTEIKVVTFETVGAGLRTVYVYLSTREANGSLTGDALKQAKANYATARSKYLEAGKMMQDSITNPKAFNATGYQALLDEAARIVAGLQGVK